MNYPDQNKSILIVEDDSDLRELLKRRFYSAGYQVYKAEDAECAIEIINSYMIQYALIDLRLKPGRHGLIVLEHLIQKNSTAKAVVFTGFGSIHTAVKAIKMGASNYLTKPAKFTQILEAFEGNIDTNYNLPTLDEVTEEYTNRVLESFDGNISKTARILGIHRRSLQRKLSK